MATKEFILQGFTRRTHGAAVRELFAIPNVEHVVLSVAYVSEAGVREIEAELKANGTHVTILAGIRNPITSYQALARLHAIVGSRLYVVDTGSRNVIFHPKLFLVRGTSHARLVIGSANLTLGGLNNNVEAGMLILFDLANAADKAVVDGIESELAAIPVNYPLNVGLVSSDTELVDLLTAGRIVDESVTHPPRPTTSASGPNVSDTVPRLRLKVPPRRPQRAYAPKLPKRSATTSAPPAPTPAPAAAAIGVEFELVWESKPLTRRDLTIPDAAGTHATGSMNLDKGLLEEAVDHRSYFREDIFAGLTWARRGPTVDEAMADFQLVIKGVSYGEFELEVRHTTSTTSKAYLQRNAMTRLSWGPMRDYVAKPNLIGRALALYRDKADGARFILEID